MKFSYKMFKLYLLVAFTLLLTACEIAPIDEKNIEASNYSDVESSNIVLGQKALDFNLQNSKDEMIQLSKILTEKNALVVFYRGEWCAYCVSQLESLEAILPQLKDLNTQVIAISPDTVATNKNTQRQFGQGYIFLSDVGLNIAELYGIKKDEEKPHPSTFLINQQGEIVWFYISSDHSQRPTGSQVLEVIKNKL